MSVNIQTPNGLVNISGDKVTKKKVISALGYTPANEEHSHDEYYTKEETDALIPEDEVVYIEYIGSLSSIVAQGSMMLGTLRQIYEAYESGKKPVLRLVNYSNRSYYTDVYPNVSKRVVNNILSREIYIPIFDSSYNGSHLIIMARYFPDDASLGDNTPMGVLVYHLASKDSDDLTNYYKKTEVYTQSETDQKIADRTGKVVIIEPSSTFNSNAFKVSDARLIYDEYVKGNTVIVKGTTSYYVISNVFVATYDNEITITSNNGSRYYEHSFDITNDEYNSTSVTRFYSGRFAGIDHTHDEYYTKEETDQKITDAATGGTVDLSNYYTKEETDQKIADIDTDDVAYIECEKNLNFIIQQKSIPSSVLKQIYDIYMSGKRPVLRLKSSEYYTEVYPYITTYSSNTSYMHIYIPIFEGTTTGNTLLITAGASSATTSDGYTGINVYRFVSETDLNGFYTKEETDTKISEAIENIDIPETDLSDYYNKTEIDNKLEEKADATHHHDSTYALAEHTHDEYAVINHKHDSEYAPKDHNHNESYSPIGHVHEDLATIEYVDAEIENKADATHKHDGTTTSYGYDIIQSSNISNTNEGCTYGFIYDSTLGGLTPNNKGVNKSFAYAKLSFTMPEYGSLTLSVNQSSEKNYDYGWVSKLDMDLPKDYETTTEDSSVKYNAKGLDGAAAITFDHVSRGTHYITIRYRKDSSSSSGDDTFTITSLTANYKVDAYATENRIYDILDAYMTANYENGDTGSY